MPTKKNPETAEQQSERFEQAVREAIDAGELSPTDGDAGIDLVVRHSALPARKAQRRT